MESPLLATQPEEAVMQAEGLVEPKYVRHARQANSYRMEKSALGGE